MYKLMCGLCSFSATSFVSTAIDFYLQLMRIVTIEGFKVKKKRVHFEDSGGGLHFSTLPLYRTETDYNPYSLFLGIERDFSVQIMCVYFFLPLPS